MNKTIFSRRLGNDEIDIWMDLLKGRTHTSQSEDLAISFSSLENGLFYISSLDEMPFGGSAVYIDRYGLGIALVDIIVKPQFINESSYPVIKSSMPYFRSLSIKNVDVIVNPSEEVPDVPFPLAFGVNPNLLATLKKIGFEDVHELYHVKIRNVSKVPGIKNGFISDTSPDIDCSLELYWSLYKQAGVDCSHFWFTFDLLMQRKHLYTITNKDRIIAIFGCEHLGKQLLVTPFLIDPESITPSQMASCLFSLADDKISQIDFPLVGNGQLSYIREFAERISGEISTRELQLMRKTL